MASTSREKSGAMERWWANQITNSGCLIEGRWENNVVVGKFFMIKPDGNCFLGEQHNGEVFGFIYPFSKVAEAFNLCGRADGSLNDVKTVTTASVKRAPFCDLPYDLTFTKWADSGDLEFSYWEKSEGGKPRVERKILLNPAAKDGRKSARPVESHGISKEARPEKGAEAKESGGPKGGRKKILNDSSGGIDGK